MMALHPVHPRFFRYLLVFLVLVISYLAFTPIHHAVVERLPDKLNHASAFLALAFAVDFAFPERKFGLWKVLVLLGYGVLIELVQKFLPFRDAEVLDVVADGVGLLIYGAILPMLRRVPVLEERWRP